jgi:hypothetical protein
MPETETVTLYTMHENLQWQKMVTHASDLSTLAEQVIAQKRLSYPKEDAVEVETVFGCAVVVTDECVTITPKGNQNGRRPQ